MEEDDARGREGGEFGFPYWVPVLRRFQPHDPFFISGNIERELLAKQLALELTEEERKQIESMEDVEGWNISCPIAGCGAQLNCLDNFEDHYRTRHTASCSVCWRVYPTSRLLSIHVSEAHDSFFLAKVSRGFPMYECLVENCGVKFKCYKSRQQHLVDKHKFPATFEFFKKAHPSKKKRQKFQGKQADGKREEGKESKMEVEQKVDELASAVSKLSTSDSSPTTISFGRRHARGLSFLPRAAQQNRKHGSSQEIQKDSTISGRIFVGIHISAFTPKYRKLMHMDYPS